MGYVRYQTRGFSVFEAPNADVAIQLLIAPPEIEILFTDVDMLGGMDGLMLAAAVRHCWPPVPIIVTSGNRQNALRRPTRRGTLRHRPYNPDPIATTMREMVR
jgi:CheY-like chemotaxis protein